MTRDILKFCRKSVFLKTIYLSYLQLQCSLNIQELEVILQFLVHTMIQPPPSPVTHILRFNKFCNLYFFPYYRGEGRHTYTYYIDRYILNSILFLYMLVLHVLKIFFSFALHAIYSFVHLIYLIMHFFSLIN